MPDLIKVNEVTNIATVIIIWGSDLFEIKWYIIKAVIGSLNNKQEVLGRSNRLLSFDMTRTSICLFACVFVKAVTFLPSRYLATVKGYIYRQTEGSDL
jgi:hypothetical protein